MIRSVEWAKQHVRTVLEENLAERLEAGRALWADGLRIAVPRPGLRPDGDYYQHLVDPETVSQFPACCVYVRESRSQPGVTSSTIHQAHLVTVRFLDTVSGAYDVGSVEALVRRLERYEAAVKDLFVWRKTRLQTLDVPAGIAAGVTWLASRFPNEPGGVRTAEVDFSVRVHENQGS